MSRDFLHLAEQASAPSPKTAQTLTASLPNLTGTAEGTFQITGPAEVAGRLRPCAGDGCDGRRVPAGSGRRRCALCRTASLRVDNGVVKSGAATLTAHGTADGVGRDLSADFAASGLDLIRFHRFLDPYADVTGTASFSGHFGGTPQSPHVALTALDVPDLVVDSQKFAPLTLAGRYDDGVLTQTGAPWRFVVSCPDRLRRRSRRAGGISTSTACG